MICSQSATITNLLTTLRELYYPVNKMAVECGLGTMRKMEMDDDGCEFEIDLPPPMTGSVHIDKETTIEFIEEIRQMCLTLMTWTSRLDEYKLGASTVAYKYVLIKLTRLSDVVAKAKDVSTIEAARLLARELALEGEKIDTCLSCQGKMEYLH